MNNPTFKEAMQKAQAEAAQWLEDHESELSDFDADHVPSGTHKFESSHELYGEELEQAQHTEDKREESIMSLVTAIDVDRGYYEVSEQEDSPLEQGGIFNVTTLDHWSKKRPEDMKYCERQARTVWGYIGTGHNGGFKPEGFAKHNARQAKKRARFGLEMCYLNNGKVRAALKSEEQIKVEASQRVTKLENLLDDLAL